MKKTYIIPAMMVEETVAEQMMLATSLPVNHNTTVDGSQALVKDGAWEDFDEDEEE